MELVHISISIILLFIIWKFMWQSSIHGLYKDKLDDLYEATEDWIAKKKLSNEEAAQSVLDYLNFCRNNLKSLTFVRFFLYSTLLALGSKREKAFREEAETKFVTKDKLLRRKIHVIRSSATLLIIKHMLTANPLLLLAAVTVACIVIPIIAFTKSWVTIKDALKYQTVNRVDKQLEGLSSTNYC